MCRRDARQRFSIQPLSTNATHGFFGKLRVSLPLATDTYATALSVHVPDVLILRTQTQMIRIDARGRVARMHHDPIGAPMDHAICAAMRALVLGARNPVSAVSVLVARSRPQPTSSIWLRDGTGLNVVNCPNHCIGPMFGDGGICDPGLGRPGCAGEAPGAVPCGTPGGPPGPPCCMAACCCI